MERADGEGWWEVEEAMEAALEEEIWLTEEVELMREKAVRGRRGLGRWRWKKPPPLVLLVPDRAMEGAGSKEGVEEKDCPPGVVAPVPYSRSGLEGRELGRDPGLLPGREEGLDPGGDVWSRLSVFMSSESIQWRWSSRSSAMSAGETVVTGVTDPELLRERTLLWGL